MKTMRVFAAALSSLSLALGGVAVAHAPAAAATVLPDGAHDFDFNLGVWKTHIHRVLDPLVPDSPAIDLEGTVTVRGVWDGRGQVEEIEADGPKGHWEGMTLFLYNPSAHQWNQYFVNSKSGVITNPMTGSFHDGRGELYAGDTIDGRAIIVRAVWSDIAPDAHRYDESYSVDGGRTWLPSFTAHLTRAHA